MESQPEDKEVQRSKLKLRQITNAAQLIALEKLMPD